MSKDKKFLLQIASQLEDWAGESIVSGWSTHQVEPMRKLSKNIHEYINRCEGR